MPVETCCGRVRIDSKHDEAPQLRRSFRLLHSGHDIRRRIGRLLPLYSQVVLAREFCGKFCDGKVVAGEKWME